MSSDAVRVVPLWVADELLAPTPEAAPAPPQLSYRGGRLLTGVGVATLFWGSKWQQPTQAPLVDHVNRFFDYVVTSPLLDQLAEYSVPGQRIGHGSRVGTATLTTSDPRHSVSDADIQHLLQVRTGPGGSLPQPTPNTLYFVFLPPGVWVAQGGGRSCLTFCGYHEAMGGNVFYAVMPYPGCAGCTGGLSAPDALTSTSSHELCEAITDAVPGAGWYDDHHGEIGDICAWQTERLGGYTMQLEWSNRAGRCV